MKKLYVGNLPYSYTDSDLKELFSDYGPVASATIIMDRRMNRSKGFGFVELEDDAMAAKAMETLNGSDAEGRALVVSEARPMRSDDSGNSRASAPAAPAAEAETEAPVEMAEDDLA